MNSNSEKEFPAYSNWKPVIWFLVMAYGISYSSYFLRSVVENQELDQILRIVTKFGPSVAGVVSTAMFLRSFGLRRLLSKTLAFNVHIKWYLVALFLPLAITLISAVLYILISGQSVSLNAEITATPIVFLTLFASFTFAGGGLGEELGWRGFMLPFLQDKLKLNSLRAAIIVGIAHAFWHFPAYGFATILYSVFAIALSIVMVWIFNRTRKNVMLMIVMHGSLNASLSYMEDLFPILDNNMMVVAIIMIFWVLLALTLKNKLESEPSL